jgi:hypothetical protein
MRGVPREQRAISAVPLASIAKSRIAAERRIIFSKSAT